MFHSTSTQQGQTVFLIVWYNCNFLPCSCTVISLLGFYILSNLIKHVFRVPHEDPSGQSIVLPRYEFHRIVQSAQVLTKEQRMAQLEQMKRQKEAEMVIRLNILSLEITFLFINVTYIKILSLEKCITSHDHF